MVVLLDTNLLVLLVVGSASRDLVGTHKRTRTYTLDDFDRLRRDMAAATRFITTPNILTETSNLARQIKDPARTSVGAALKRYVDRSEEIYVASAEAAADRHYARLGLTDAGIIAALVAGATLLTDDLDLYVASTRAGLRAVNFSQGRM